MCFSEKWNGNSFLSGLLWKTSLHQQRVRERERVVCVHKGEQMDKRNSICILTSTTVVLLVVVLELDFLRFHLCCFLLKTKTLGGSIYIYMNICTLHPYDIFPLALLPPTFSFVLGFLKWFASLYVQPFLWIIVNTNSYFSLLHIVIFLGEHFLNCGKISLNTKPCIILNDVSSSNADQENTINYLL